jgi:outer membrane protein assembly factor BamA
MPPVEMAFFFDAGSAWTSGDRPDFMGGSAKTVTSQGVALRVNLFGFAIGEVDYVHPNDRPLKGSFWQFSFQPGF